jgi:hypothetical protein
MFETNDISFAAYLKLLGYKLSRVEPRRFVFDDIKDSHNLRVQYLNSESRQHDIELLGLRDLQRAVRETENRQI